MAANSSWLLVTVEQARVEMVAIARQLAAEHPDTNSGMGVSIEPLRDIFTGNVRTMLLVLQTAVLVMLLIACANLANLLLVRASAREREVAIRLALGAGKRRLLGQFLTEGILLALMGAATGILLAYLGVAALARILPEYTAEMAGAGHAQAWIDIPVLLSTLAISILAGVVFGAAPAFQSQVSPHDRLKAGGRGLSENAVKVRLRRALVVSQIALSLVLLIGSGLMVRSLLRLQDRQLGFRSDHLLTMVLSLPMDRYPNQLRTTAFIQQTLQKLKATPGVEAAGAINTMALTGMSVHRNFTIPGRPDLAYAQQSTADLMLVTPDYFRVMSIPLLRGRWFDDRDHAGSAGVVIINEMLAQTYWPGEDPIGKMISIADLGTPAVRVIVGVVGDTRQHGLANEVEPGVYRPFYQAYSPFLGLVVRTAGLPQSVTNTVTQAIWAVDKDQPVNSVRTMEQLVESSIISRRANTLLLGVFGMISALLAVMGLYGVVAYSVARRTHEIGVRMALGAQGRDVMLAVLRDAVLLASSGVLIGLPAAIAGTRFLRSMLVEISATDSVTLVVFPILLIVVALVAAYVPARRASKVDPIIALRYD